MKKIIAITCLIALGNSSLLAQGGSSFNLKEFSIIAISVVFVIATVMTLLNVYEMLVKMKEKEIADKHNIKL